MENSLIQEVMLEIFYKPLAEEFYKTYLEKNWGCEEELHEWLEQKSSNF